MFICTICTLPLRHSYIIFRLFSTTTCYYNIIIILQSGLSMFIPRTYTVNIWWTIIFPSTHGGSGDGQHLYHFLLVFHKCSSTVTNMDRLMYLDSLRTISFTRKQTIESPSFTQDYHYLPQVFHYIF